VKNLSPFILEKKLKTIKKRLENEIEDYLGNRGDCGNFSFALSRVIGGFYVCSYWSEGAIIEETPDHCACLWCPNITMENYENCKLLWDKDGKITFSDLREYSLREQKEHIKAVGNSKWALDEEDIVVEVYTDLDEPYGFLEIADAEKIIQMEKIMREELGSYLNEKRMRVILKGGKIIPTSFKINSLNTIVEEKTYTQMLIELEVYLLHILAKSDNKATIEVIISLFHTNNLSYSVDLLMDTLNGLIKDQYVEIEGIMTKKKRLKETYMIYFSITEKGERYYEFRKPLLGEFVLGKIIL